MTRISAERLDQSSCDGGDLASGVSLALSRLNYRNLSSLIDWIKIEGNSPNSERIYSDCFGQFQGISPGWIDQYHHSLESVSLSINGTPFSFVSAVANLHKAP